MAIKLIKSWRGFPVGHVFDGVLSGGVENLLVERLKVAKYDNRMDNPKNDRSVDPAPNTRRRKKSSANQ